MSKHIARKRFGQHFLTDKSIITDIVDAINPQVGQVRVEIGPGLAALTQPLVERLGHLTVIELDRDLAARAVEAVPVPGWMLGDARILSENSASAGDGIFGENSSPAPQISRA